LNKEVTEKEKEKIETLSRGKSLGQMSAELLSAFDPDKIDEEAQKELQKIPPVEMTPAIEEEIRKKAQQRLADVASSTFNGELNEYIVAVRSLHDQKIDTINIDTVLVSGFNSFTLEKAKETVKDFSEYLEQHKDEIMALSIFYNQPYNRRNLTLKMAQELLEKLKQDKPLLAPAYVWDAYCAIENVKAAQPKAELTALVSLVRHACGIDQKLTAFDSAINANYQRWILRQNAGNHTRFTPEQIDWLRMIKDHIVSSYHLDLDDLDYTPFDAQGGRGKMYQLFGNEMEKIIEELNEVLVA
jgi:type I restriction enzyme R subunit